jgi:hypothetical protein
VSFSQRYDSEASMCALVGDVKELEWRQRELFFQECGERSLFSLVSK